MSNLFDRLPKYIQIKEAIRHDIEQGVLREGQQLPSEMHLIERFGASKMTVIRALQELVQEGLLRRVQGKGTYVRKPDHRGPALGVMLPCENCGRHWQLLQALEEQASELGYETSVCFTQSNTTKVDRFIARLIDRRAAGLIAAPLENAPAATENRRWYNLLKKAQIPLMLLDGAFDFECDAWSIGFDHEGGMRDMTQTAANCGHRRLMLVDCDRMRPSVRQARVKGFKQIMENTGSPVEWVEYFTFDGGLSEEENFRRFDLTFRQASPSAILCLDDEIAWRILRGKPELRQPGSVSITGFGGGRLAEMTQLTTLELPWADLGRRAAELMNAWLKGGRPHAETLKGAVIRRASLQEINRYATAMTS